MREERFLFQADREYTDVGTNKQSDEQTYESVPSDFSPPTNVDGITVQQLTKMGSYLLQGMNETEAATLAGIDKLKLVIARRKSPLYNDFVERKKLEFKAKHLRILATKPDAKVSQWLLERLAPEEFSSRAKPEVPTNVVSTIIKEIQNAGDSAASLAFAYKDIYDKNRGHPQGASRLEAKDNIRSVLK